MRIEVPLPDLGEDAGDEATVAFWYFEVGDDVAEGDDLLEMVTDKATFQVPSPAGGRLSEVLSMEGDKVKVGQVMAILEG